MNYNFQGRQSGQKSISATLRGLEAIWKDVLGYHNYEANFHIFSHCFVCLYSVSVHIYIICIIRILI